MKKIAAFTKAKLVFNQRRYNSNWALCGGASPWMNENKYRQCPELWPGYGTYNNYSIIDASDEIDRIRKTLDTYWITKDEFELNPLSSSRIVAPHLVKSIITGEPYEHMDEFYVKPKYFADEIIAHQGIRSSILPAQTKYGLTSRIFKYKPSSDKWWWWASSLNSNYVQIFDSRANEFLRELVRLLWTNRDDVSDIKFVSDYYITTINSFGGDTTNFETKSELIFQENTPQIIQSTLDAIHFDTSLQISHCHQTIIPGEHDRLFDLQVEEIIKEKTKKYFDSK